jgi:uncharacterized membrane protein YdbT with pleckstrin-like domain
VDERIFFDQRRHGVTLVRPLGRSLLLAVVGVFGLVLGWPGSIAGAVLLLTAGLYALAAVWQWDRTKVVLTSEQLFVVHGVLHRNAAAVRLQKVQAIELRQSLLGRVLGYGTLVAGDLEITAVPRVREVCAVAQNLAG